MKTVRCAIYTRKSSEEGLEQAFNSLDAQREACAAYILSQASEGWTALPDIYDDGGLSGGTLERPALQRLLTDVAAGRIDIIVVYKVDRLTRSLLDFAKLVEAFDGASTSFVSVTQSFNTTTSMGRLTLNMLLSFAQFEREVTAERIRDKIAASKAKGMWMGGTPPLGYQPNGRSLTIVDDHAALIIEIYERYLELGNVRRVTEELAANGVRTPRRITGSGRMFGGGVFSRGQIYKILGNPLYAGDIVHNGKTYPGLHEPIIERGRWQQVQERLAANLQGERSAARAARPSLFAGLISDEHGVPLKCSHACKGKVRYRYYESTSDDRQGGGRFPAREIETAVCERIARALDDPITLATELGVLGSGTDLQMIVERGQVLAADVRRGDRQTIRALITHIRIASERIQIDLAAPEIAGRLGYGSDDELEAVLSIEAQVRLTRTGRTLRLVQTDGTAVGNARIDPALVGIVSKAQRWWAELKLGELNVRDLAARENVTETYVTWLVRVAFLAPDIVDAILAGRQPAHLKRRALTHGETIPPRWDDQRRIFGFVT